MTTIAGSLSSSPLEELFSGQGSPKLTTNAQHFWVASAQACAARYVRRDSPLFVTNQWLACWLCIARHRDVILLFWKSPMSFHNECPEKPSMDHCSSVCFASHLSVCHLFSSCLQCISASERRVARMRAKFLSSVCAS
jgi:hypothetical protein